VFLPRRLLGRRALLEQFFICTLLRLDALLEVLTAEYDRKLPRRQWVELSRLLEAFYAEHVD